MYHLANCFHRHLRPGGWVELSDSISPVSCDDGTLPPNSALLQWNTILLEASIKLGAPLNSALKYKEQLKEAGFVNIVEHRFRWPINGWPRDRDAKLLGKPDGDSVLKMTNLRLTSDFLRQHGV